MKTSQPEFARVLFSNDGGGDGFEVMTDPSRALATPEYFFGGAKKILTLFYRMSFHHQMKRCIVQRLRLSDEWLVVWR
jgi:hypothetical protein